LFHDDEIFQPQNVIVKDVSVNGQPVKKHLNQTSSSDWAYLANYTHALEPTNMSRKNIVRGADWIKFFWSDCRKYIHTMFIQ